MSKGKVFHASAADTDARVMAIPRLFFSKTDELKTVWLEDLDIRIYRYSLSSLLDIINTNTLIKFHKDLWKMWPLKYSQGFSIIWPGDLVFTPSWPRFELNLDIINTNILNKVHKDPFENVASRAVTRFFYYLTWWPSFKSKWTQILN